MAPEGLIRGRQVFSKKTDVYSYSITLCEVVNQTDPYEGMTQTFVALEVPV